jgi:hypothetical protein
MKKLSLFVFALLLTACAPAVQGLTQLPDEGRLLVFVVISAAVTWLLLKLSEVSGVDLKGYAPAVAAALAPILVALIEYGLGLIPSIYDNFVLTIIHLLVLLVGSLGTFFLVKRKAPTLR